MGRTITEKDLQFVLDGRTRDEILLHFLGELAAEQLVEYGHRKEQLFREEAEDMQAIAGVRNFLQDLEDSEVVLGVASSGSRHRVGFLLDRLGLRKHFRSVVTADSVERGKPHPAVYLKASEELQVATSEMIAFEDAFSGVKAAKSAGMRCVGITHPDGAPALLAAGADHIEPDFCCLSYSKLKELFG
jgi:HAD superfamily hydrolase (TIGR01509 family)